MPFDTYTNLLVSLDNYLGQRVELQPIYPDFVSLAERRMYRDVRAREMIRRTVALLNETWKWLPVDFIKARRVTANPGMQTNTAFTSVRLTGMSTGQLEAQYVGQAEYPMPEAYAIEGMQIRFAPALSTQSLPSGILDPTQYRNFEIVYYARFPALDATDTPTNVVLDTYPELYLYGALIEAEPYLIDDQRIAVWKGMYDDAVNRINLMAEYDVASALTMGVAGDGQYMP